MLIWDIPFHSCSETIGQLSIDLVQYSLLLFLVKNSCKEVLIFVHVNLSNIYIYIYIYIFIYLHVQFFCAQVECHFNQRSCLVEMIQALSPIHCRLTGILLSSYGIIWDIVVLGKCVQPTLLIILTIPSNLHIFTLSLESKNRLVWIRSHS